MQAAIDGGFDIVEFTLTTPGCLDQVANFRKKYDGKVMVGCGTVMDIPDAKAAMDAGAEFLVAPCLVPEVVTWCALNNIVIIPGCQTPTEAYQAYRAGAQVQKIFPGVAGHEDSGLRRVQADAGVRAEGYGHIRQVQGLRRPSHAQGGAVRTGDAGGHRRRLRHRRVHADDTR